MPGPGAHSFGDEERAEVLDVLATGHLSRYGDLTDPDFRHKVHDLEQEFATFCGTSYALATNSGTSALYLALEALGVGDGDEVLVPGFTYVATYSAILQTGATPVLVEIDDSLTIDPIDLERKVTPRSKAIMVVHMLGAPCDMDAVLAIVERHGLSLIEDACQAAGATYNGRRVGSFGEFGAFSFNRYKMIAAGEGGMLVSHDADLHARAFALHDQGHSPAAPSKTSSASGPTGLNLKMAELTGAVALAQLRKTDRMLATLRSRKQSMRSHIADMEGVSPRRLNDPEGECATFLTWIFDDPHRASAVAGLLGTTTMKETGWHNYRLMNHTLTRGTTTARWSAFARHAEPGALPQTDDYLARSLSISIGVVDRGLGASFGIDIRSERDAVEAAAELFRRAVEETRPDI